MEKLAKSGMTPVVTAQRAKILLLEEQGKSSSDIAEYKGSGKNLAPAGGYMKLSRKDIDKIIRESIQKDVKDYHLKSRGCILYKKVNSYFITILAGASGMKQEKIKVIGYVKPYIIDDIFWKVFQMPENSKEPMGLRANGAFTVDPLEVYSQSVEYKEYDKIGIIARELFSECYEKTLDVIEKFDSYTDFLMFAKSKSEKTLFDYNLVAMLLLIDEGKYQEAEKIAVELMRNKEYGRFKNEGKFIYEWIKEFCDLNTQ